MIIPVLHRIIVKQEDVAEANETFKKMKELGLEIPESDTYKREQHAVEKGVVVAIGDTAFKDFKADLIPAIGDKVLYAKYAGKSVKDNDEDFLVLNDEDIIGIIKEQ